MKFYIPHLRDRIRFTNDWTFPLHRESRNDPSVFGVSWEDTDEDISEWHKERKRLWNESEDYYNDVREHEANFPTRDCTIPAGTILGIDRVFIRQGAEDYDSVTFRSYGQGLPKGRFWIKLDDINGAEIERVESGV